MNYNVLFSLDIVGVINYLCLEKWFWFCSDLLFTGACKVHVIVCGHLIDTINKWDEYDMEDLNFCLSIKY